MTDLTDALLDPELGAVSFSVERTVYRRYHGTLTASSHSFSATGCVHPAPPETLRLSPGEETRERMILIYSPVPLFDGESETSDASFTAADLVTVLGGVWRVIRVRPWVAFGLYQALAVRIGSSDG